MPLQYFEKLNIGPLKTSNVVLRMADNTAVKAVGIIEDVLVKVDDFIFPAAFIILNMKVDKQVPLILGRNFLATCKALIDVGRGEITVRDNNNKSTYHIESAMLKDEETRRAKKEEECMMVMMSDKSKPFKPLEGEDTSKPSIFIVTPKPQSAIKKKSKLLHTPLQERTSRKKKSIHLIDSKVYVIKTANGSSSGGRKFTTN